MPADSVHFVERGKRVQCYLYLQWHVDSNWLAFRSDVCTIFLNELLKFKYYRCWKFEIRNGKYWKHLTGQTVSEKEQR